MKQLIVKAFLSFAVLVIAAMVLLSALGRTTSGRMRSLMQTRGIVQSLQLWAIDHDGVFPRADTWRQDLIGAEMLYDDGFDSRVPDVEVAYVYIEPAPSDWSAMLDAGRSDVILLYEHPDVWRRKDGHVGYVDGRVEWVEGAAYRALVERLRAGE